ncbi:hypothetical protein AVEN_184204-1 [Araneus ventricosus]|uniref:Uncharacterized protein n=1 Tax=Araneus ventricosus TaxID=182803 RepID=A0A4Y2IP84_ARAVE|nr:hypothetical protein AVEN_184204-1 [Araneus ventricosus]
MSCCRISKKELASPGSIAMMGVIPPSSDRMYLLREGSGRGQLIAYYDFGFSTQAVVVAIVVLYPGCFGVTVLRLMLPPDVLQL